jgi:hypothetical protein
MIDIACIFCNDKREREFFISAIEWHRKGRRRKMTKLTLIHFLLSCNRSQYAGSQFMIIMNGMNEGEKERERRENYACDSLWHYNE